MASYSLLLALYYDKCDASLVVQLFSSLYVNNSVMFLYLKCIMLHGKNCVSLSSPYVLMLVNESMNM